MRCKKKSSERIAFIFPEDEMEILKNDPDSCYSYFIEINSAKDAVHQINILKKVQNKLILKDYSKLKFYPDVDVVCFMFYQSPLNSFHKKNLSQILKLLYQVHLEAVENSLLDSLELFLTTTLETVSMKGVERFTDCLLGLLDNFPLGTHVIEKKYSLIWQHINDILLYTISKLNEPNVVDVLGACLPVLKAFCLIIQNCPEIQKLLASSDDRHFETCCSSIVGSLEALLLHNSTTLNCRYNAGIAWCSSSFAADPETFKDNIFCSNGPAKYPVSSQLCIYAGTMTVLSTKEFASPFHDDVVAKIVLQKILCISESIEDAELLLLCTRDLLQWCNKMCEVLKLALSLADFEMSIEVKRLFEEDGDVMNVIFEYVLRYREHYVDTLRHLSKELFKKMINLHLLSTYTDPCSSQLLKRMALFLLNDLPAHSPGKYGLLSCIVDLVGASSVLKWHPSLPEDLYRGLGHVHLISHISEVLESLFRKSHDETDESSFHEIWLKPLMKYLNSESKEFGIAMIEHVLPKLHKARPESLEFLIEELVKRMNRIKGNSFSVLMTCIKLFQSRSLNETVFDFLPIGSFQLALTHGNDQVRLSAFCMICESTKTTEVVREEAFDLIMQFLPYNMNCQAPAFRQQLVSHLKKLLNRMVHSRSTFSRKKADNPGLVDYFNQVETTYERFIIWLKKFLLESLFPGANFPRRVTALHLLSLLHACFPETFSRSQELSEIQTLLYALQDTYENNKQLSLNILQSIDASILATQDEDYFKTLLETSLTLASSAKPPDTVTAAYLIAFMVKSEHSGAVLLNHLLASMESGPHLMEVRRDSLPQLSGSSSFVGLLLLSGELLKQLTVAQESLCDAAASAPLYGILACMRRIISEVDFNFLDDSFSVHEWASLVRELISLGIQVAKVVEPVVSNASPEGHLPMDPDSDTILKFQAAVRRSIGKRFQSAVVELEDSVPESDRVVLDRVKTHAVTAQILLLCCWRTHKEVSLLFGEIVDRIPVCEDAESGILSVTRVKDIADYFMHQMASVKHKGAFEQAYIGFTKLCEMLWRSPVVELQELPQNLLNDLFLAIKGLKEETNFSYTRRSAGLPFIIQAILTSEPGISSSLFFKKTITSLLSMAFYQKDSGHVDEMVHALNILRALFRDSSLSDALIPFVSEALVASITGFKSSYWIVRNSSHLLFSALLTRIFGPHNDFEKTNRLTGRTFFSYYKEIYAFLFEELKECAAVMNQNRESLSLYPVLLLLGRLYPAPGECDSRLASFVPFLNVCSGSAIWKVRVLAAQGLVPLISAENFFSTLQSLFGSLPWNGQVITGQNRIHGTCLQIFHLLRECCHLPIDCRRVIEENLRAWIHSHSELASNVNPCYTTRVAFLDIVVLGMALNCRLDDYFLLNLMQDIQTIPTGPEVGCMKEHYLCLSATVILLCLLQMEQHAVDDLLTKLDSSLSTLIQTLLLSPFESVRCMVLHSLECLFQEDDDTSIRDLSPSIVPLFYSEIIASAVSTVKKRKIFVLSELRRDLGLSGFLAKMLETEKSSSSCVGKVCHLLCVMLSAEEQDRSADSPCSCSRLEYVLDLLQNSKRGEVSNLILLFASHLGVQVYRHLPKPLTDHCPRCLPALRRWCEVLERSVQPESCSSRRTAAVISFRKMPPGLLLNEHRVLGDFAIQLWQTLLVLVTDDEPDIKEMAAEFICSMKKSSSNDKRSLVSAIPSFATEHLMKTFATEDICPPSHRIAVLLNWILSCKTQAVDCMGDEQPFDRGELNVYLEDLFLTRLASKVLTGYLLSLDSQDISSLRIRDWRTLKEAKDPEFTIDEVVALCLDESKQLLDRLHSRRAVSPFLDPSLNSDIVQITQRLSAVSSLAPSASLSLLSRAQKLLEEMEELASYSAQVLSLVQKSIEELNVCICEKR